MSDKSLSQRTSVSVFFGGVDISRDVNASLVSLTYTDNEADEADDLQIELADPTGYWLTEFFREMVEKSIDHSLTYNMSKSKVYYGAGKPCKVTAKSGLNVRKGAGTGYSRLGALPFGTTVEVFSIRGNWATVRYNGQTGYCYASYLEETAKTIDATAVKNSNMKSALKITGFRVQAVILAQKEGVDTTLDCGLFELDDSSYANSTMKIKATSLPYASPIRQCKKSKAWEGYTLKKIAGEIAASNNMGLLYSAANEPLYKRREQVQCSDIAFLQNLCTDAGLSLKVTANVLVIYDASEYEGKSAVLTIQRNAGSYTKPSLKCDKNGDQYDACRIKYVNPATGAVIEGYFEPPLKEGERKKKAKDKQILELTRKVGNVAEANVLAKKLLRKVNRFAMTATFTMMGNTALVAGVTVQLLDFGAFSGTYIVSTATHTVGGNGYKTKIKLRKRLEGY